jgi:hypothetical protein
MYYKKLNHYYYTLQKSTFLPFPSIKTHINYYPLLRITILIKTSTTSLRQSSTSLFRDRTTQTNRPLLITILRRDSISIRDNTPRLVLRSLYDDSLDIASISVIVVGQIHNRSCIQGIATKENSMFVETFGEESVERGDVRHTSEVLGLGCFVGAYDCCARGEEVGGICAIVGGDDDVDFALWLDQRPEGHGGVAFTAIDELDFFLCVGEGGGRVLVKWVRVGSVKIAGYRAVGVEYNGLESLHQRLSVVLCGDGATVGVEEGGTGACYVADVVVVFDTYVGYGGYAVGQFGSEVCGLGEGVDVRVPGSEFVRSLLDDRLVKDNVKE